jgi:hypothetical protein
MAPKVTAGADIVNCSWGSEVGGDDATGQMSLFAFSEYLACFSQAMGHPNTVNSPASYPEAFSGSSRPG